jgi:hypothetical protein
MATLPVLEFSSTPFLVRSTSSARSVHGERCPSDDAVDELDTGQCAAMGGNTEAGEDVTSPRDND